MNEKKSVVSVNTRTPSLHSSLSDLSQSPESEPIIRYELLDEGKGETPNAERYIILVRSYRCGTQCDHDNLVEKYFIDALRYAGIIPEDTTKEVISLTIGKKVKTKKEERTEIEIVRTNSFIVDLARL